MVDYVVNAIGILQGIEEKLVTHNLGDGSQVVRDMATGMRNALQAIRNVAAKTAKEKVYMEKRIKEEFLSTKTSVEATN